jgi:hypothetical protein
MTNIRIDTEFQPSFTATNCFWSAQECVMLNKEAYAHEIAALLIAGIRTSGAQTASEIREAFRVSLQSLLGDGEIPARSPS